MALLCALSLAGCVDGDKGKALGTAADRNTCVAQATPAATPYPSGFPAAWQWPTGTVVFNVEDRGSTGVIATGVTSTAFKDVLAFLNGPVSAAGYKVGKGETEAHDAEANWDGNGYRGRWAIRESTTCPGETVIQVLSTKH